MSATVSINDYTGFWTLDAANTDDYSDVLAAQGVSWLVRKVILNMTLTYDITAMPALSGVESLVSVNPKGNKQQFILDGQAHPDDDAVFGQVQHTATKNDKGEFVLTTVSAGKNTWKNTGTWVLENGGNTMVRHLSFESPKLAKTFKMTFTKKQ
ncbi:hypothetical protein HKX48_003676 [Thoreauomyces humboldtii]|nr:hypothetical protein HKX48_003676 [Thoreauomyces humboldtii]